MMFLFLLAACDVGGTDTMDKQPTDTASTDTPCEGAAYADADGDGFGDAEVPCDTDGAVLVAGDCDDADADVHPGAEERCNQVDDNCDGVTEGPSTTWYADADGDGHGDASATSEACAAPDGHVAAGDDCDDTSAWVYPGATELCDLIDNDCDDAIEPEGTASFESAAGNWKDLAADLVPGERGYGSVAEGQAGTVWLCGGTYFPYFTAQNDLAIVGRAEFPRPTLAGEHGHVVVTHDDVTLALENLLITGGTDGAVRIQQGVRATMTDVEFAGQTTTEDGSAISVIEDAQLSATRLYVHDTVAGGSGALYVDGEAVVELIDPVFEDNTSGFGGGIGGLADSVTLQGGRFARNTSASTGGAIAVVGTVSATDTTFEDNLAVGYAGTVSASTLLLYGVTITRSTAGSSGGAINLGANSRVEDTTVTECEAGGAGGAIYTTTTGAVTLIRVRLADNVATESGGGLHATYTSLIVEDSEISGNTAAEGGGGIAILSGGLEGTGLTVADNVAAGDGGGLLLTADMAEALVLDASSFTGNVAGGGGGGLHVTDAGRTDESVLFTDVEVERNTATAEGGGFLAEGTAVSLIGGTLVDNRAETGGGAWVDGGDVLLDGVPVTGNAASRGGALRASGRSELEIVGGTEVSGNTASTAAGVLLEEYGDLAVCTDARIAGNTVGDFALDFASTTGSFTGTNCVIGALEVEGATVDLAGATAFTCRYSGCD